MCNVFCPQVDGLLHVGCELHDCFRDSYDLSQLNFWYTVPQFLIYWFHPPGDIFEKELQKKISNLHIVTDIKVTIDSLPLFGFRHLGGGMGNLVQRKKRLFL